MQITELLTATFLDPLPAPSTSFTPPPPASTLSNLLTSLHTHILSLPTLAPLPVDSAIQRLSPHVIPFVHPAPTSKSVKWTLGWEKPSEILICGDWSLMGHHRRGKKDGVVELNAIDMAVVMPDSLFTVKDRTANRYFQKRAHYLAVIGSSLSTLISSKNEKASKSKEGSPGGDSELDDVWKSLTIGWEWVGGDERRAGLVLTVPKSKSFHTILLTSIRLD